MALVCSCVVVLLAVEMQNSACGWSPRRSPRSGGARFSGLLWWDFGIDQLDRTDRIADMGTYRLNSSVTLI